MTPYILIGIVSLAVLVAVPLLLVELDARRRWARLVADLPEVELKRTAYRDRVMVEVPGIPQGADVLVVRVAGPQAEVRYLTADRWWTVTVPLAWLESYRGEYPHTEW